MNKLFAFLKRRLNINNDRLLEKDIILHRLLSRMMKTPFKKNYAFKGGTCLIKCYLGYYRFSEDLDFTYINQKEFEGKSQKQIRKIISQKINRVMVLLAKITEELNLDFKPDKSDKKYIVLGGSNKFATFKLWYKPITSLKSEFIKVQINYSELILNNLVKAKAKSLFSLIPKIDIELLQPDYADIIEEIELIAYPLKEIFLEKIRAILTRRGTKSRDYIDVYLIDKITEIDFKKFEPEVIEKIRFMLVYDKYLQNLSVINSEKLILSEEKQLLLKPLDDGFKKFLPNLFEYLKKLEARLKMESKRKYEL